MQSAEMETTILATADARRIPGDDFAIGQHIAARMDLDLDRSAVPVIATVLIVPAMGRFNDGWRIDWGDDDHLMLPV